MALWSMYAHRISAMTLPDTWKQTELWKAIDSRSKNVDERRRAVADDVSLRLRNILPDIEKVLAKGETAPADFTLHDEGHGYRVAQRIAQLLDPDFDHLSTSELALLLLSAYLHDIGMTPVAGKVKRHRKYLMFGGVDVLSTPEREQLQTWLDENAGAVAPPLLKSLDDADALERVDLLVTHYSRSRHNDWSEEWIRANFKSPHVQLYNGCVDDLVRLCRSHHVDYRHLIQDGFNPTYVQVAGQQEIVHHRYLAALLRVGDILEFDPERTPPIVFDHRGISAGSTIYWYKDHEAILVQSGPVLTFFARPRSALIMHALQQMADEIDRELDLCWHLENENRFSLTPLSNAASERRWQFEARLKRDIHPKDGSFEEFDGAFKPNVQRLLGLVSGTQLYGTNLAAVRELLQNALDAVRLRIAFQRLAQKESGGAADPDAIASLHSVDLSIDLVDGRYQLVCRDSGIGMTKETLRRRFLATGATAGHLEADLERRCREHGFRVGRTGQFGIGAASYFMLAKSVQIITRRSQDAGDAESTGWQFEISGVDGIGELRRSAAPAVGTTVRLVLRQEVLERHVGAWVSEVAKYLRKNVTRVPCRVTLRDESGHVVIDWKHGWTADESEMREQVVDELLPHTVRGGEPPFDLLSSRRQQEIQNEHKSIEQRRSEVRSSIRLLTAEGDLPGNVGKYRIHLPYFEYDDGACLVSLSIRHSDDRTFIEIRDRHSYLLPLRNRTLSWNGIAVNTEGFHRFSTMQRHRPPFLEIDWTSAEVAELELNRKTMHFGANAEAAIDFIYERAHQLSLEFVDQHSASRFTAFNCRLLGVPQSSTSPVEWTFWDRAERAYELRPIQFPAIDRGQIGDPEPVSAAWNSHIVERIDPFGHRGKTFGSEIVCWATVYAGPSRVVSVAYEQAMYPFLFGLWETPGTGTLESAFPPQWPLVGAVMFYPYSGNVVETWSASHPVAAAVDTNALSWSRKTFKRGNLDPLVHKDELLADRAKSCAWLMYVATTHAQEFWNGFAERNGGFVDAIWKIAFNGHELQERPVVIVVMSHGYLELRVITRTRWEEIKMPGGNLSTVQSYLPEPGAHWTIRFNEPETDSPDDADHDMEAGGNISEPPAGERD